MSAQIILKNVRIAFCQSLWEKQQVNGEGQPAHSAVFLLAADDPQVDEVNDLIDKVAAESKWGAKSKTILGVLRGKDAICIHNGDTKAQYEGFEGNWYVSARSYTKVLVVDRDKTPLGPDAGKPYAGCYVDASIEVWVQDNKWGKRVNATLRWVQFRRDGDAFAGGAPASMDEVPNIAMDEGEGGDDDTPLV